VRRPKRGFNPPLGIWLKGELAPLVDARLTPDAMAAAGLDWRPVKALLDEFRQGRRDHSLKVWALLALGAWQAAQ
jgi:asparagine synthase (glutamine-hydrolysing)